jgi:hypothetical protein
MGTPTGVAGCPEGSGLPIMADDAEVLLTVRRSLLSPNLSLSQSVHHK